MVTAGVSYSILVQGNNLRLKNGFIAISSVVLVQTQHRKILVDTGHHVTRHALLDALQERNLSPTDIDTVVLTHLHFDHVNNVDLFADAEVIVSQRELDYADNPHKDDLLIPAMIKQQLALMNTTVINAETELDTGVTVVPTPGHTPGHISVLLETQQGRRVAIAGDAIKYPKETLTCGCDMVFATPEEGEQSIARLMEFADTIVPGHFPEIHKTERGTFVWEQGAEFNLIVR